MSAAGEKLQALLDQFKFEDDKFEGGNNAAGTRARKALMELKRACDVRRKEIQEKKNAV